MPRSPSTQQQRYRERPGAFDYLQQLLKSNHCLTAQVLPEMADVPQTEPPQTITVKIAA